MLFFDLDGTVIFSKRRIVSNPEDLVLVESLEGRPLSYMTPKAHEGLQELIRRNVFIPVTARGVDQYARLSFAGSPEHVVVDSGTEIFRHGVLDQEWLDILREKVDAGPIKEFRKLGKAMDGHVATVQNLTWRARFVNAELAGAFYAEAETFVGGKWRLHQEDRRVFLLNSAISKANATQYLHEKYDIPILFASGDNVADVPMVRLAEFGLCPQESRFYDFKGYDDIPKTTSQGEFGGEEIIQLALKLTS